MIKKSENMANTNEKKTRTSNQKGNIKWTLYAFIRFISFIKLLIASFSAPFRTHSFAALYHYYITQANFKLLSLAH